MLLRILTGNYKAVITSYKYRFFTFGDMEAHKEISIPMALPIILMKFLIRTHTIIRSLVLDGKYLSRKQMYAKGLKSLNGVKECTIIRTIWSNQNLANPCKGRLVSAFFITLKMDFKRVFNYLRGSDKGCAKMRQTGNVDFLHYPCAYNILHYFRANNSGFCSG